MSFNLRDEALRASEERRLNRARSQVQESLSTDEHVFLNEVALPLLDRTLGWGQSDDVLVFEVAVHAPLSTNLLGAFVVLSPADDPDLKLYVRKFDDDQLATAYVAVRQGNVWAPAHPHPLVSLADLGDLLR